MVDLPRIARILDRDGFVFQRRILTVQEQSWCYQGDLPPVVRVAACLAVKESLIKALGGRPVGFRWPDLEILPIEPAPVPEQLTVLWSDLALKTQVSAGNFHRCRVASGEQAWAAWGTSNKVVVALVIMMR